MATRLSVAARNASVGAVAARLDAGPAAGYLEVRTGSQPATPDTAATGTLLATLTLSDPAFGAASNGTATAAAITGDTSADATGTAGWVRAYDSTGAVVLDGAAAVSGAEFNFASTSFIQGGTVNLTSFTLSQPTG